MATTIDPNRTYLGNEPELLALVPTIHAFEICEAKCVWHWVAAEDEAQARGLVVGHVLSSGTVEESSEASWLARRLDQVRAAAIKVYDDGECRPLTAFLDRPQYVACSEY
jgi:hypothetical protein